MAIQDRIRLTGLLRKKPWKQGFFYGSDSPATRQARPARADSGLRGTARNGRRARAIVAYRVAINDLLDWSEANGRSVLEEATIVDYLMAYQQRARPA